VPAYVPPSLKVGLLKNAALEVLPVAEEAANPGAAVEAVYAVAAADPAAGAQEADPAASAKLRDIRSFSSPF